MYDRNDPIGPGDRAPDFTLATPDGQPVNLYTRIRGGIPVVLFYADGAAAEADAGALEALAPRLAALRVEPFVVVAGERAPALPAPFRAVIDPAGGTIGQFGFAAGDAPMTLRFDPNLRLMGLRRGGATTLADMLDRLEARPPAPEGRLVTAAAPVLLIPHVLTAEDCAGLIRRHEQEGSEPSTVTFNRDGRDVREVHRSQKSRSDHVIADRDVLAKLDAAFARRVNPEIEKAFHFRVAARDGFNITRYDAAEDGHFSLHRDNVSPTTAHFRFAVTINLNFGEYEGGELSFPEYGPDRYAPPTGGAVVFSCSHLHEARSVTKGSRFALLTFLFGAAEAQALRARRAG